MCLLQSDQGRVTETDRSVDFCLSLPVAAYPECSGTGDLQCLSDQNRVVGLVGFVECWIETNAVRFLQSIPEVVQLLAAIFLQSEHVGIFFCDQVDNRIAPVAPAVQDSLLTDARIAKVV